MKLIFIKDGVVVNTLVAPENDLQTYEKIILERGYGFPVQMVDTILHESDDAYVSIGFLYDGQSYTSPEIIREIPLTAQQIKDGVPAIDIQEEFTIPTAEVFVVTKENILDVTDEIITLSKENLVKKPQSKTP